LYLLWFFSIIHVCGIHIAPDSSNPLFLPGSLFTDNFAWLPHLSCLPSALCEWPLWSVIVITPSWVFSSLPYDTFLAEPQSRNSSNCSNSLCVSHSTHMTEYD
jgi:hypothetical protein